MRFSALDDIPKPRLWRNPICPAGFRFSTSCWPQGANQWSVAQSRPRSQLISDVSMPVTWATGHEHACRTDLRMLAASWARRRATNRRRAVPLPSPKERFRSTARGFFRDAGKWVTPAAATGPCEDRIQAFLVAQQERGLAPATCIKRIKHARKFVAYLEQHDIRLEQVRASHLDAYFQHLAASRCRLSMGPRRNHCALGCAIARRRATCARGSRRQ